MSNNPRVVACKVELVVTKMELTIKIDKTADIRPYIALSTTNGPRI